MRQEILDELNELARKGDGLTDADVAAFVASVDGVNREADGLIHREAETPAPDSPPATEPVQEQVREIELDETALAAITAQFNELLNPLKEQLAGLQAALAGVTERMAKTENDMQTGVGTLDRRLQSFEQERQKQEQIRREDMPRHQKLAVTYRPREAHAAGQNAAGGQQQTSMADIAAASLANMPSYHH